MVTSIFLVTGFAAFMNYTLGFSLRNELDASNAVILRCLIHEKARDKQYAERERQITQKEQAIAQERIEALTVSKAMMSDLRVVADYLKFYWPEFEYRAAMEQRIATCCRSTRTPTTKSAMC